MTKQFAILSALRATKIMLSLCALILYGRMFGVSSGMDAWVFSTSIILAISIFIFGPINETVRSQYYSLLGEHDAYVANRSANSILLTVFFACCLIAGVFFFFAQDVFRCIFLVDDSYRYNAALNVFILMLPSILLNQLSTLTSTFLNCLNSIYAPEFLGIASSAINLASVFYLGHDYGVYSLVLGYYIGYSLAIVVSILLLHYKGFFVALGSVNHIISDSSGFVSLALPLFVPFLFGQVYNVLEKSLSVEMGLGIVSLINYASQIKSTLQAVLSTVIATLILPKLTYAYSKKDNIDFDAVLIKSIRLTMLFLFFVIPIFIGSAEAISESVLGSNVVETISDFSLLIRTYVLALIPVSIYVVLTSALLSRRQTLFYGLLAVSAQAFMSIYILLFAKNIGFLVFAQALFISHSLVVVAIFLYFKKCGVSFDGTGFFYNIVILLVLIGIFWLLGARLLYPYFGALNTLVGIFLFCFLAVIFLYFYCRHCRREFCLQNLFKLY